MNHNNNDNDHNKNCKCKLLPLSLSTTTAAEYGDLASLTHRLNNRKKKSQNLHLLSHRSDYVVDSRTRTTSTTKSDNDTAAAAASSNAKQSIIGITTNTSTPLHLAAQNGHAAITSYLLQNGYHADLGYHSSTLLVSQQSQQAQQAQTHQRTNRIATPLHRACYSGALSCIKLLLDNGADDMAIDYSMDDAMTPLHKAVKGGRYYAVALLIRHFQEKQSSIPRSKSRKEITEVTSESNDDNNGAKYCNCLKLALDAKDKQNRKPLELARELQTRGEEEVLSLRRWDAVAGHTRADFNQCTQLLENATAVAISTLQEQRRQHKKYQKRLPMFMEKKDSKSTDDGVCTMILTHSTSNDTSSSPSVSNKSSSISILNSKFVPLCNCENIGDDDDGQCKTLLWEKAFNKALFDSTSALLNTSNRTNQDLNGHKKETKIQQQQQQQQQQDWQRINAKQSRSIQMKQHEKITTNNEKECPTICNSFGVNTNTIANTSGCTNEDSNKAIVLGQQCQSCSVQTMSLFRSRDGRFVCRKCMKNTRVQYHNQ